MTSDATGRQARATGGTPSDATDARVLSITEAAQVLGLSIRTVQRRLDAGTLEVVEVEGVRRVRLPLDATVGDRVTRQPGRQVARHGTPTNATEGDKPAPQVLVPGTREEELKEEIRFLRGVVEQQQRDAAELRAALREALKISTRALPEAGTPQVLAASSAAAQEAAGSAAQVEAEQVDAQAQSEPLRTPEREGGASTGERSRGLRGWLLKMLRG